MNYLKVRMRVLSILCAIALAVSLCSGCSSGKDNSQDLSQPVKVALAEVREQKVSLLEPVVGTVRAGLKSSVEAKISARIERYLVSPGQAVNSGDLLVELDSRDLRSHADAANLKRDQAARDFERLKKLKASNAISEQQFEDAQTNLAVTKAASEDATTALSYAKILASYKGVITRKLADAGDMTSPGKPLLEMEDPTALRLEVEVPEALIANLSLNSKIDVEIGTPAAKYVAVVVEISPTADPNSRTFLVKADLPKDEHVRSGLFGRAFISAGQRPTILAPAQAVVKRGQLELAYVAVAGHAQLRLIKTGRVIGGDTEILSGLSSGEKIVVSPSLELRDGSAIIE